ncbi:hypothetical protein [Nocardia thailandica]|uniref:hypothetical protein n=1 Tax=Nocardia thailandica TaxID=257275 RepID=UPI0002E334AE|nr:hypothetical protein [Nocardia thailandica]
MDEEIGYERAQQPLPETRERIAPQGYSMSILLQLRQIDLLKELMRLLPAVFGGKLPPPFPPEPRPQTAEQYFREVIEKIELTDAVNALLGIDNN